MVSPWLASAGKGLAAKVVPLLFDYVRKTKNWKKIADKIQDWTSVDLHDYNHDVFGALNLMGNDIQQGYAAISSSKKTDHSRVKSSMSSTGVNITAVCCALNPSAYIGRFPTVSEPVGLLSKEAQFVMTTNAAGNVACVLQPFNVFGNVGYIFNDVTFNPVTGQQTPVGSNIAGVYSGLPGSIEKFQLISF